MGQTPCVTSERRPYLAVVMVGSASVCSLVENWSYFSKVDERKSVLSCEELAAWWVCVVLLIVQQIGSDHRYAEHRRAPLPFPRR
jgi:hypothetical protein